MQFLDLEVMDDTKDSNYNARATIQMNQLKLIYN